MTLLAGGTDAGFGETGLLGAEIDVASGRSDLLGCQSAALTSPVIPLNDIDQTVRVTRTRGESFQ